MKRLVVKIRGELLAKSTASHLIYRGFAFQCEVTEGEFPSSDRVYAFEADAEAVEGFPVACDTVEHTIVDVCEKCGHNIADHGDPHKGETCSWGACPCTLATDRFVPMPDDPDHCANCDLHESNHGPGGECADAEERYLGPENEPDGESDGVKRCPECERPNQFGELCANCARAMAEEGI